MAASKEIKCGGVDSLTTWANWPYAAGISA